MALVQKGLSTTCLQLQDGYDRYKMSVLLDGGQIQELNYTQYWK
jgi:hypothetical protein